MVPLGVLLVILGTILRGILYIHKLPINRKAADTCIHILNGAAATQGEGVWGADAPPQGSARGGGPITF